MSARRVVGSALSLLVAAACAPHSGVSVPRPLAPQDGPNASIHAMYSGGLIYRTINATFSVDQMAFALVGHLGGDGVIRVLYPESPRATGVVRGKKAVRIPSFAAMYDGAPGLMSFAVSPFRSQGSRMDSYDGGGNGFIFVIASRNRFNFDEISDGFAFDDVDVANYYHAFDARLAILDFAEHVAGGPFTLKFANSFSTQGFTSSAARAWDCSVLAAGGYGAMFSFWNYWGGGLPSVWSMGHFGRSRSHSYCGDQYAYGYGDPYRRRWYATGPTPDTTTTKPGLPVGPITPTLTRPPRRPITGPGRALAFEGGSAIERPTPITRGSRNSNVTRRRADRPIENETAHRRTADRPSRTRDGARAERRDDGARTEQPRSTTRSEPSRPSSSGERPSARPAETPRMTAPAREAPRPASTTTARKPDKPEPRER